MVVAIFRAHASLPLRPPAQQERADGRPCRNGETGPCILVSRACLITEATRSGLHDTMQRRCRMDIWRVLDGALQGALARPGNPPTRCQHCRRQGGPIFVWPTRQGEKGGLGLKLSRRFAGLRIECGKEQMRTLPCDREKCGQGGRGGLNFVKDGLTNLPIGILRCLCLRCLCRSPDEGANPASDHLPPRASRLGAVSFYRRPCAGASFPKNYPLMHFLY